MKRTNRRLAITAHNPAAESLELRLCLSSVGWDGAGQGSATLTYYVGQAPDAFSLTQAEVESAVSAALKAWSDVIDVTFVETTIANLPDSIDIEFGSIDGAGGTLAQAYFPDDVNPAIIAGDVLVDVAETWEIGNDLGSAAFDLTYVLVHELGHSLGLDHSTSPDSVMYPSVSPSKSFTGLSSEDVDAALALYAPAELTTAVPDDPTTDPTTDPTNQDDPPPTEETPTEDPPTETPPTDPTEDPTEDPGDDDTPTEDEPEDNPEETPPSEDDPTEDPTDTDDDSDDDGDTEEPPTEEKPTFPPFGNRWAHNPFQGFTPRSGHSPFQRFAGNAPQNSIVEISSANEVFVFVRYRRR